MNHRVLLIAALSSIWSSASSPCRADTPALPEEALVIASVGRYGRTPAPTDAIQALIAAGQWKTPKAGDTLTGADGTERAWGTVPVKDGALKHQALNGGYALFTVKADAERVMILDAAGHSLVLVNGAPRVGDHYQTGYVKVPVLLKKGDNEFLFHVQRGSLRAKLIEPKAAAQLRMGDVTAPSLPANM